MKQSTCLVEDLNSEVTLCGLPAKTVTRTSLDVYAEFHNGSIERGEKIDKGFLCEDCAKVPIFMEKK